MSEGRQMLSRLSSLKKEYSANYGTYVNLLTIDADSNYTDVELIFELIVIGNKDAKKALLEVYTAKGDSVNAQLLRQELASTEHPHYIALLETLESLYQCASFFDALNANSTLYDALNFLQKSDEVIVAGISKSILDGYNGYFEDPIFSPLISSSAMGLPQSQNQQDEYPHNTNIMNAYPNPSTSKVYFGLPNQDEDHMIIELFDLAGKQITKI